MPHFVGIIPMVSGKVAPKLAPIATAMIGIGAAVSQTFRFFVRLVRHNALHEMRASI